MDNEHASNLHDTLRETLRESARLLQHNHPAEAIDLLVPLHREYPNDADLAINLGGAYILQRKWNKAVSVLEAAAQSNPENVMVWTNLAAAHLGRLETAGPKHQKRAIAAYEKALALDPKVPNVHYHLGLIYKERGELPKAIRHFEQAMDVNPADRDAKQWRDRLERILEAQKDENDASANDDTSLSSPADASE